MFSSMHFIDSVLIFRSLIHFELLLVCGDRQQSSFSLLQVAFQFSQHHLLKRLSFLYCMFLAFLLKIIFPYKYGFTSGFLILFQWSVCLFCSQYHAVLITVALYVVSFEVRQSDASSLFLFSQDGFGNSESFVLPYKSEDFFVPFL
uniref:Uncharacterized protein n=1 Tax=Rousettus aegyptiacus TaxID=9407 RepID=A0A7J8KB67_ROUAE|nr:hypothetical protein HJG63_007912 [Rousettus aegyptiacus]